MCFTFVIVAIVDVMKQIQSHETHDFDERRRSRVSIRRSFVAAAARDPGTRRAGGVVGSFTTRDQCPLTTSFVRSFVGRGRGWLVCRSSVGRSSVGRSVGQRTHSLGRSVNALGRSVDQRSSTAMSTSVEDPSEAGGALSFVASSNGDARR